MPGIDGFAAAKAIKNSEGLNVKVLIIALTANILATEEISNSSMDDFLAKPFKITDLSEKITLHLPGKKTSRQKGEICDADCNGRQTAVLNSSTLKMLIDLGDPGCEHQFLNELIETFEEETPQIVKNLLDALDMNDAKNIEHYSHKLKGFSSNLGAQSLASVCEHVERNCDNLSSDERKISALQIQQQHQLSIEKLNADWKLLAAS